MKLNLAALALFTLGVATNNGSNAENVPTNNHLRGQSQQQQQRELGATHGFHETLGRCSGAVCGMWGDPHMVTCDGLQYDCQGIGLFTLMDNHMFNVQGNFVDVGAREHVKVRGWGLTHGASITNDIMIEYKTSPDVPIMQFGFGDVEGYHETVPSEEGCAPWIMLEPLVMGGHGNGRSMEDDLAACRARCDRLTGCTQFTYFADGGCYPNTAEAVPVRSNREWSRALSGTMDGVCGTANIHALPVAGSSGEEEKHGEIKNSCPLLMYLDGELIDLSGITPGPTNGRVFLWGQEGDDHYVTLENNDQVHIVHKLPGDDSNDYTEIELRRQGQGPGELWSCHWNFYVCLPVAQQDEFEDTTVGLLGTPNGRQGDDWMTPDGTTLPLKVNGRERHQTTMEYCVDNWCVAQADSLMTYHGDTDYGDHKCQEQDHFDWKEDNENCVLGADQIVQACKDMPAHTQDACAIDCCAGGCGQIQDNVDQIKDIVVNDSEKDDVVFDFDGDNDDGSCGGDADGDKVLENTPSTICPGANIVKLLRTKGDEPLPTNTDIFYDMTFDEGEGTVGFKINNPFEAGAAAFVRHEKAVSIGSFTDATCDAAQLTPFPCTNDNFQIDVKCKDFGNGLNFALVNVYFASVAVSPLNEQAVIDRCCNAGDGFDPAVGIVEYTFEVRCGCPDGEEPQQPTPQQTDPPVKKPAPDVNAETAAPTAGATTTAPEPTDPPAPEPTDPPAPEPTDPPAPEPTDPPPPPPSEDDDDFSCGALTNLGDGFSEATGDPQWSQECYPPVVGLNANNLPGRDDSVAVFVGGNYIGKNAAEVEGNMVVLGNLEVRNKGPGNFVSVGAGTHVLPHSGGDCIIVGGDLASSRDIQVFNQVNSMSCNIVVKGRARSGNRWKTNGKVVVDNDYDLSRYEKMKYVLGKKSQYWKTLPSNAEVKEQDTTTTFNCNTPEGEDIAVFNVPKEERGIFNRASSYLFEDNCEGKTVLINVHGSGDISVKAAAMRFKGMQGYGENGFSTCLTQSILWNFPDAATVNIGAGRSSEFHGSLLVGGNLKMTTTGHSGRTMVLGNIIHDKGGSEFHTYQFAPPTPLPDPEDVCVLPEDYRTATAATYAPAATVPPTPRPPIQGCKAIPRSRLPQSSGSATDGQCKRCEGPNPKTYWPCDQRTLCEGECIFSK